MPANKLLSYPHDVFLMVRLEFVQICGDELEAKVLRVIERYVDEERTRLFQEAVNKAEGTPEQVMTITKDVWVSISYRLFMSDLFGTIASENTIKKAINSLLEKKIIFRRFDKKNRYDAPEYRIHIPVVQMLLNVVGKSGYQKLIPSIIDTLKKLHPHEMTPSECQNLMLSSQSRVSEIDTNYNKGNDNNNIGNNTRESANAPTRTETSSQETDLEKTEKRKVIQKETIQDGYQHTDIDSVVDSDLSPGDLNTQSSKATNASTLKQATRASNMGTQPPLPQKPQANVIPKRPRRQGLTDTKPVEPEPIPEKALEILDRWDSISKKPTPRTPEVIKDAILFMAVDPTAEEMKGCRAWLFTTDDPKKPWYRKIGVGFHDVVKNFSKWQSLQEAQPMKSPGKDESNEHKTANFYSAQSVMERNKWKMEAFQAEYEAKTAAMQEVQS